VRESGPPRPVFRPRRIIAALAGSGLRFVVIGGVAERLHGSPRGTGDIDICPATEPADLAALAQVLNELDAVFRPAGLEGGFAPPAPWDERSFTACTSLALATRYGWLDLCFRPDGTSGYPDFERAAVAMDVDGRRILVASLDDIIRNKEAAGGTKYLSHLPLLRDLRDRLQREAR